MTHSSRKIEGTSRNYPRLPFILTRSRSCKYPVLYKILYKIMELRPSRCRPNRYNIAQVAVRAQMDAGRNSVQEGQP
jgi:hypothetical protein